VSDMTDARRASPHRRRNPLTGDWVLVSPQRVERPWQGQVESLPAVEPVYDPACYLCPGNERAGGVRNPAYEGVFVFDNDFPALLPVADPLPSETEEDELLVARPETGICRVVCFSPRHDTSLSCMSSAAIADVVAVWQAQLRELAARPGVGYVQVFENRGAMMGCSNPHPHGQIWASGSIPNEPLREQGTQAAHLARRGSCLLCDVLARELALGERVVCENEEFVTIVPFWAAWPFETLVVSRRHRCDLAALSPGESLGLADILRRTTARYDNLFATSFPYSMGFHQRPADGQPHPEWHLHAHFYPPLLRSATVRKFMVGYEMLAAPQRDLTAEHAAAELRRAAESAFSNSLSTQGKT
jgi:UDPglucose--hexose-1-phosphate uridylyltransferase